MKFKNGREIEVDDKCVGVDHFGGRATGVALKGVPAKGQPDFVFKNDAHGAVQPSLDLQTFLHADDAATQPLSTAK